MMPPKAKDRRGRGRTVVESEPEPVEPPTEKELMLKTERAENEWLQEQANNVRVENHEYMAYVEKKTTKRQTTVVSLSDYNRKQIDELQHQEELVTAEFEKRKDELMSKLLEKETKLEKTNRELEELHALKIVQRNHIDRIRQLERDILSLRSRHTEKIQQLKAAFVREKQDCMQIAEKKVADMSKQASQEAVLCLDVHEQRVRAENRALRHELLTLIRKSQALHQHERNLLEQRRVLRNERQYAEDIGRLSSPERLKIGVGPALPQLTL